MADSPVLYVYYRPDNDDSYPGVPNRHITEADWARFSLSQRRTVENATTQEGYTRRKVWVHRDLVDETEQERADREAAEQAAREAYERGQSIVRYREFEKVLPGPGEVIVGSADGPVARDVSELGPGGVPVGADAVENVSLIQQAIDAATPGSTVRLPPGVEIPVNGTIHVRSRITLDLNGCTLTAVPNATFEDIDLGAYYEGSEELFRPPSVKPIIALMGTDGARIHHAKVVNGTIDGNGLNQPAEGAYANVAVFLADDCTVDVVSVNARPGIMAISPMGRAYCVLVGKAARTIIHGYYDNAGYDAVALRSGAIDTVIDRVFAGKAGRGSVQAASLSARTTITNSVLNNSEGELSSSHSLFCHSAKGMKVSNTTLINHGLGQAFHAFGDDVAGWTEDVVLTNVHIDQGNTPGFMLTSNYVRRITAEDITYKKAGSDAVIKITGAAQDISFIRWRGTTDSLSASVDISGASNIKLDDCDFDRPNVTGNPLVLMTNVTSSKIQGGSYSASAVPVYVSGSSDVSVERAKLTGADSVRAIADSSNIDVLDCDLRDVTNANKLRMYATSGLIRGNRGATTEANGTATVAAGATSVTVTHGLWPGSNITSTPRTDRLWLPQDFQVSFAGNPGDASKVWVSAVTPTQVTFTVDAAPGADVTLAWSAAMNRRTQP